MGRGRVCPHFSRSIGLYNQFREPPDAGILQPTYLRSYHRYADFAYAAWRELRKGAPAGRAVPLHVVRLRRVRQDARRAGANLSL
ncbi:MAG: hypothetical protein R2748_34350 [Bryobacterales bacterium]